MAPIIAVNGAAGEVAADFLYSRHPERFRDPPFCWKGRQLKRFGAVPTVHSASRRRHPRAVSWVDHWWLDTGGGGGSGWGARKLAGLLGFDLVVLCGMPLVPGNYSGNRPGKLMTRDTVIADFRKGIEEEPEWHEGVLSMSGWTAARFGTTT